MSSKVQPSNRIEDVDEGFPSSVIVDPDHLVKEGSRRSSAKAIGWSELLWASKTGNLSIIQSYLKSDFNVDRELNKLDSSDMSLLHYAVRYDRPEVAKLLLENHADVNVCSPTGVPPVFTAVRYNSEATLQVLVQFKCNLNALDLNGGTLLHEAGKCGFPNICHILLKHNNALINIQDNDLLSPLHVACRLGMEEVCRLLLEFDADITMSSADGSFALHYAAASGNITVIQSLLSQARKLGRNVENEVQMRDCEGQTPLHRAIQNWRFQAVEELIENGAKVMDVEKNGRTSLHIACASGCNEIVSILISKGSNVNATDSQRKTPLHYAAMLGQTTICETLLKEGADLHSVDRRQRTAFMFAIAKGQNDVAGFLLRQGCNIERVDDLNQNSLHIAIQENRFEMLQLLLEVVKKQTINSKDAFGRTPLHYAAEFGNYEMITLLLSYGATVEIFDSDNNSPLHCGCKNGQYSVIELLFGHNKILLNSSGERSRTPLHLAVLSGSKQTVQILISHCSMLDKIDASCATPLEIACERGYLGIVELFLKDRSQPDLISHLGDCCLHIAALHGHADIVKILLEHGADCTIIDKADETCLDIAINRGWDDVAIVIVSHPSGRKILNRVDKTGSSVLQSLIQKLPRVAKVVMNQCIKTTFNGITNELKVEYDFSIIDPGPIYEYDHRINGSRINLNALQSMVNCKRDDLLMHPLSQKLLINKWNHFGWIAYYFSLVVYIVFVTSLSGFAIYQGNYYATQHFNREAIIGLDIPSRTAVQPIPLTHPANTSKTTCIHDDSIDDSPIEATFLTLILIFAIMNLMKEAYQIVYHKWLYFQYVENYMELALYVNIIVARFPITCLDDKLTLLSFMIFLAYINLLVQIQRMDVIGVYVIMLRSMVETICKVLVIVFILALGFAISFHLLDPQNVSLDSVPLALVRIMVMTVGEFDYRDSFLTDIADGSIRYPRSIMTLIILVFFIIIMPVMVINLMVGLAVGDIDKVRSEAALKRIILQVNSLISLERALPLYLRKRYYTDYKISFRSKSVTEFLAKIDQTSLELESKKMDDITMQRIDNIEEQLSGQKHKLEHIAGQLDAIRTAVEKISNYKLSEV
ncbi:Transient receptor potential cation channel subfamily A member 1 [Trichoplax sp. H2]|nr:Transient receptor potential cation channel subfamily A member 1 [Trichoplax sp. H2]|eukprot:RDD43877.1 Transient receptor potential cation channel subfamily A member 1 [Trichoplax sp. H2]